MFSNHKRISFQGFQQSSPFYLLLIIFFLISSCKTKTLETSFSYNQQSPQISFAVSQIKEVLSENPVLRAEFQKFSFIQNDKGEEDAGYAIQVKGKEILISANSANSLMYGGFEVAEQLELNTEIVNTSHTPFVKKRGIKMNIPLDARTPGYDDTGDAAQKNIGTMWEWEFWEQHINQMAINRYNVLTLWNPHPFPSMIKMEHYPDVALSNVCATTLKPTGKESEWAEPQMVSSNVVENLRVLKEIGIEEKIAFWQKVMQHAHDRGIEIYYFNWNICANGAASPVPPGYRTYRQPLWDEVPGKYGITNQMDNPINVKYYREAVKTFLLTYPHVKGIGVTAGEHMMDDCGVYTREQWMWETYGLGIMDAKKEMPERKVDFIHRVWNTNMDKVFKYWTGYPDSFEGSLKYAKARLYSTATPDFANKHIESMKKYGLKSWWNLRNDDIFVHRWGDADYVRAFVNHMQSEHSAGFYMGSDGYIWGREFNSKSPELAGQLEVTKHWYRFMLWGRLAYNKQLDTDFFERKIAHHFPETDARKLYTAWQTASKIIPLVNCYHWNDWDYQWSVEACIDTRNGFHDIHRFMTNPTLKNSGVLNPEDYAKNIKSGDKTPYDVAKELHALASESINVVDVLRNESNSAELAILLDDLQSMAYLGQYYATKIEAAAELALFNQNKNEEHKIKSVALLKKCVEHWKGYANIIDKNYKPQMLARTGNFDVFEILEEVEADVSKAQSLKL